MRKPTKGGANPSDLPEGVALRIAREARAANLRDLLRLNYPIPEVLTAVEQEITNEEEFITYSSIVFTYDGEEFECRIFSHPQVVGGEPVPSLHLFPEDPDINGFMRMYKLLQGGYEIIDSIQNIHEEHHVFGEYYTTPTKHGVLLKTMVALGRRYFGRFNDFHPDAISIRQRLFRIERNERFHPTFGPYLNLVRQEILQDGGELSNVRNLPNELQETIYRKALANRLEELFPQTNPIPELMLDRFRPPVGEEATAVRELPFEYDNKTFVFRVDMNIIQLLLNNKPILRMFKLPNTSQFQIQDFIQSSEVLTQFVQDEYYASSETHATLLGAMLAVGRQVYATDTDFRLENIRLVFTEYIIDQRNKSYDSVPSFIQMVKNE